MPNRAHDPPGKTAGSAPEALPRPVPGGAYRTDAAGVTAQAGAGVPEVGALEVGAPGIGQPELGAGKFAGTRE